MGLPDAMQRLLLEPEGVLVAAEGLLPLASAVQLTRALLAAPPPRCLCAVIEDLLGSSYFDERMVQPQVRPC